MADEQQRLATINPARGDVVEVRGDEREVTEVRDGQVFFRFHTGEVHAMPLALWREWASAATSFVTRGTT